MTLASVGSGAMAEAGDTPVQAMSLESLLSSAFLSPIARKVSIREYVSFCCCCEEISARHRVQWGIPGSSTCAGIMPTYMELHRWPTKAVCRDAGALRRYKQTCNCLGSMLVVGFRFERQGNDGGTS